MLEAVVGAVATLLVLTGVAIMIGPHWRGIVRSLHLARASLEPLGQPAPARVHPTTERVLSQTESLAALLLEHGQKRLAAGLRRAGARLIEEEPSGIHAMRQALQALRNVDLGDPRDQEIFLGLTRQAARALDDRAEQLELLPRN